MLNLIQDSKAKELVDKVVAVIEYYEPNEGESYVEEFFFEWFHDSDYGDSDRFFENIDLSMAKELEQEVETWGILLTEEAFEAEFWACHEEIDKTDKPLVRLCFNLYLDDAYAQNRITDRQVQNFCLVGY